MKKLLFIFISSFLIVVLNPHDANSSVFSTNNKRSGANANEEIQKVAEEAEAAQGVIIGELKLQAHGYPGDQGQSSSINNQVNKIEKRFSEVNDIFFKPIKGPDGIASDAVLFGVDIQENFAEYEKEKKQSSGEYHDRKEEPSLIRKGHDKYIAELEKMLFEDNPDFTKAESDKLIAQRELLLRDAAARAYVLADKIINEDGKDIVGEVMDDVGDAKNTRQFVVDNSTSTIKKISTLLKAYDLAIANHYLAVYKSVNMAPLLRATD